MFYDHDGLGEWKEVTIPVKTGRKVTFNFPQKWYAKRILIEAYIYEPEIKAPPGLQIKPVMGEPKIDKLEICDASGAALTKNPTYGQSIVLKVHTHNMVGETLKLSFWEKDTIVKPNFDPFYHAPKGDTALWNGTVKVLKNNGIAEAKIMLTPNMAMLANKKLFDSSVHQFYLLAEAANTKLGKTADTTPKTSERVLSPAPTPKPAPSKPVTPAKTAPAKPVVPAKKEEETSILENILVGIKNIVGWDDIKPDGSNKKVVVEVTDAPKNGDEKDCACKIYDLIWGKKVSCEFRKKVVQI